MVRNFEHLDHEVGWVDEVTKGGAKPRLFQAKGRSSDSFLSMERLQRGGGRNARAKSWGEQFLERLSGTWGTGAKSGRREEQEEWPRIIKLLVSPT